MLLLNGLIAQAVTSQGYSAQTAAIIAAVAVIAGGAVGVLVKAAVDAVSESRKRHRHELERFWEPLLDQLTNAHICFRLQGKLRNRLISMLNSRGVWRTDKMPIPIKLERVYAQMLPDEQNLHAFIREITFGGMLSANNNIVKLLERHPQYSARLESQLMQVREHLTLWIAKAKRDASKAEVCLVYVGVEDEFPFPP